MGYYWRYWHYLNKAQRLDISTGFDNCIVVTKENVFGNKHGSI